MKAIDVGRLCCRVLAIVALITGLETLQMVRAFPGQVLYGLLSSVLLLAAAAVLWFGADSIAPHMAGAKDVERVGISSSQVGRMVFVSLGLLVLADSGPDLAQSLARFLESGGPSASSLPLLIREVSKTAIGLWLLLGAHAWARWALRGGNG